jgi:hypothetical protein
MQTDAGLILLSTIHFEVMLVIVSVFHSSFVNLGIKAPSVGPEMQE